jgi:hypothetical protein
LVHSTDPVSKEFVQLSISPRGIESLLPVSAMATMAVASARDIATDVGAAFCRHVNHFATRKNAELFADESPSRHLVTVGELHALGSDFYRAIRVGLGDQFD